MSSETVSLLPCPFCGAEMVLTEREEWVHPWNDTCPADDIHISYRDEPRLSAWNRRYKPVASGVEVTPLEWLDDGSGGFVAMGSFGDYEVNPVGFLDREQWEILMPAHHLGHRDTLKEAKAAAEADYRNRILSALLPKATAPVVSEPVHSDDLAVDRFAIAMKEKLAKKRKEGRGGWERKDECSSEFLSQLLREHVEKGDPVDVGNLAMMLHQRGERIAK